MPIRKYNPTSPGRRFQTVQVFDEISTSDQKDAQGFIKLNALRLRTLGQRLRKLKRD